MKQGLGGIVIAIDGPAGAGKSTVSAGVARALGLARLDTGSMYRSLAWAALREGVEVTDGAALASLAQRIDIRPDPSGVLVDGVNREREIRSPDVSSVVSAVSSHPEVRRIMVSKQQELAKAGGAVIEGRDIGSVVAPWADLKIFLTASAAERARRRGLDLSSSGHDVDPDELRRQIEERDARDSRTTPLVPAPGAFTVDSTGKTFEQVVEEIVALARDLASPRRTP